MTIGVAACSSDASRLNERPFGAGSDMTGSVAQGVPPGPVAGRVESRPLPPQPAQAQPIQPATKIAAAGPVAGSSVVRKPGPASNWSWEGGKPVTVGTGDTIDSIARRHGVPASAIVQANNITPPATIYPGQRLVIPRYSGSPATTVVAAAAPAARPAMPAPAPAAPTSAPANAGSAGVHVVAAGDTLSKIARLYHKPVGDIAKANNLQSTTTLNVGERIVIPGAAPVPAKPSAAAPAVPAKPAALSAVKDISPVQSANVVTPAPDALDKDAAKVAEGTGALPKFRWPANGRVISAYGPTTNGQQNDGINIALPENTPVKAAEDGVVAYAGNELKGYGNLVLVRHPNGYVTAYAHAKELLVKRGDQVKRGQVIARSGQTGNVNAPQLHFEIRKGASPLDPTRFLNGA
jgi:murein DD-endopeptidase MepM/ murein hydrolase activator NlpD